MFIKKYLILLLTICITFICIQDSQSQSGRRLWGSDAYIEGDFQSNNLYAENNVSSTTGTFNVLEVDYPFDFKFYIQDLQPIVKVGNSLLLDLADDLIIGNSQSIRFYPHVEGTKIDLFDNSYTIGLEPYTFIFETDEDFEFRTDEGNTIFKILADGTVLSGSIITSSSVTIGDGYTLDFEQGTLGNKINLYGNSYNIGVIPYTLVLETDRNILMKNDTEKTLAYFSEFEGMLTDKINSEILNVTGNATVNGFNYTASPTLNGASSTESTSTSVVGGIWNGDFSVDGNVSLSIGWNSIYNGWQAYLSKLDNIANVTAFIYNGVAKLSMSATDSDGFIGLRTDISNSVSGAYTPVSPNTSYKVSFRYKTENISSSTSGGFHIYGALADSNYSTSSYPLNESYITGTSDWVYYSKTFSTGSTSAYFYFLPTLRYESGTVYLDDIKLEQVTTHTNNSTTPTVAYPVITGVSSEFVDQQNTTQDGTYANIGNTGASNYWLKQTFTPTQQKLSAISFMKGSSVGSPTGNMIIEIRNPTNAIIASVDVKKSTWDSYTNGNVYTIPVFALLDEDVANYSVVFHSDVSETAGNYYRIYWAATGSYSGGQQGYSTDNGSSWTLSGADLYFKTHYAENTRQITLTNSSTGTSTTVDWGDGGLPDGAVVDLYNGTMSWGGNINSNDANISKIFSSLYSADFGNASTKKRIFNSWNTYSSVITASGSKYLYFKIPGKYIKDATVSAKSGGDLNLSVLYSFDSSNWIKIIDVEHSLTDIYSSSVVSNGNDIYLKAGSTYSSASYLSYLGITATLDTSAIAPLLLAAGSNTVNQSVNGGSYKANVAIKSVSGGFQTTLNEANKQLTVLRNAPRSYLETPDKTQNAVVIDNDGNTTVANTIYSTTVVPEYINDSITDTSILSGRISRTVGANIYSDLADLQTVSSEDYFYNGVSTGLANDIGSVSTWSDLGQQYSQTHILSLAYLGNGIVLAGTHPSGKILRSTDYGLTWSDIGQQYSQAYILSLAYLGNGISLAGTDPDGKILRSTDYGLTWSDLGQQYSQTYIPSFAYLGNGISLAGTYPNGKILRSSIYDIASKWTLDGDSTNLYYNNGNVGIGTSAPTKKLHVEGDIYALGDISAATFTDRTPAPPEDSLTQILKVSSKNGEIDHDTLGAAKVKRVQKISYVNVYSATDNSLIVKIPTTLNENIINITEEVPEQIISEKESIELVKESAAQEGIQLKPDVVQENGVYKIPAHTKIIGQRNLIKEKIEQEYNIPQEEIILQEEEVIEEFGNRDIGMSVSMSIRSIQQLYNLIENLTNRIKILEENNK